MFIEFLKQSGKKDNLGSRKDLRHHNIYVSIGKWYKKWQINGNHMQWRQNVAQWVQQTGSVGDGDKRKQ